MNKTTEIAIEMLKVSLILGIAGNLLLRTWPPGINVLLWVLLLFGALWTLTYRRKPDLLTSDTLKFYVAGAVFAAMFALFDSVELLLLDGIGIIMVLGLMTMPALRANFRNSGTISYLGSFIASAFSSMFGPFFVIFADIEWNKLEGNGISKHLVDILRGLAIGVPVILIIGGLLMSADAAFESLVSNTLNIDPASIVKNVGFTGFLAWGVLGYLRAVVLGIRPTPGTENTIVETVAGNERESTESRFSITEHTTEDPLRNGGQNEEKKGQKSQSKTVSSKPAFPAFLRFGMVEMCIVLGLVNIVFLAFVIVQTPYLFGGIELIQQSANLKLAEYARRGVGELICVAVLVLPLLLTVHWLLKKDNAVNERVFKVLSCIQIGLLFVIMVSALQRLLLLTGSLGYGMTTFRFYAMFLLLWLALVFIWFGLTVLRGLRTRFAYGAVWSALFVLALLNFANPDAYIVQRNIELMQQGRNFDAVYNSSLSADAVPVLIDSLHLMSSEDRQTVILKLGQSGCGLAESGDFRNWNWSRSNAIYLTTAAGLETGGSSCPDGL